MLTPGFRLFLSLSAGLHLLVCLLALWAYGALLPLGSGGTGAGGAFGTGVMTLRFVEIEENGVRGDTPSVPVPGPDVAQDFIPASALNTARPHREEPGAPLVKPEDTPYFAAELASHAVPHVSPHPGHDEPGEPDETDDLDKPDKPDEPDEPDEADEESLAETRPSPRNSASVHRGQSGQGDQSGQSRQAGQSARGASAASAASGFEDLVLGRGQAPSYARFVPPRYPESLRRLGIGGRVRLRVLVDEQGRADEVEVLESPHPRLSGSARESARLSRYRPLIQNGRPAACWVRLNLLFTLK